MAHLGLYVVVCSEGAAMTLYDDDTTTAGAVQAEVDNGHADDKHGVREDVEGAGGRTELAAREDFEAGSGEDRRLRHQQPMRPSAMVADDLFSGGAAASRTSVR